MFIRSGIIAVFAVGALFTGVLTHYAYAQSNRDMIEFLSPEELMGDSNSKPMNIHDIDEKLIPASEKTPDKSIDHERHLMSTDEEEMILDRIEDASEVIHVEEIVLIEKNKTPRASYLLGGGDTLTIRVFGEKDLSGEYLINEEGFIFMPLIGEIDAKGKTIEQVADTIEVKLKDGFLRDPSVGIEIANFRPIYVMGEVRNPGSYNFVTDMTIRNAAAIAGGFTYRANQKEMHILREGMDEKTIRIEDVPPDQKIAPGDIILVKERFF